MKSKLDEDALTKKEVEELKDKIKIGYEFEWRIKAESLEDQTKTTWQRKKLRVSHKSRYLFLAKDRKGREYSITYIELAIAVRKENERIKEMLLAVDRLQEIKKQEERQYISGMEVRKIVERELPAWAHEKAMNRMRKSQKIRKKLTGDRRARRYYYKRSDVEQYIEKMKEECAKCG